MGTTLNINTSMKKIYILCFFVLGISSCSLKSNKSAEGELITTEQLKDFVDNISKNTAEFSAEQWAKLELEYEALMKKATEMKDKLSDQDTQALELLKESFETKKAESKKALEELKMNSSKKMDEMKKDFNDYVEKKVDRANEELDNQLEVAKKEAAEAIEKVQNKLN